MAQLMITSAVPTVSTEASTITSSQQQKAAAQKVQYDVQEYFSSGAMNPYLEEKVKTVKKMIGPHLSTNESLDLLLLAAETILANDN